MDFIKVENFYTSKDAFKKAKRQPTEWEKILAIHISDRRLIFRMYKELPKLSNNKNHKQLNSKMDKGLE